MRVLLEHLRIGLPKKLRHPFIGDPAGTEASRVGRSEISADGLGDGYRLDARIVIWEKADVLKVPASSRFRVGQQWSTFVIDNGRARVVPVEVGHRNTVEAEITRGLKVGATVILLKKELVSRSAGERLFQSL